MAKDKVKPGSPDAEVTAFGEAFGPSADVRAEAKPEADPLHAELERMRADLKRLEAENADLKTTAAAASKVYPAGKKYKITLRDAPTVVVETRPGEHPWDACKRICGILSSIHAPEISEAAEHEENGVYMASTGRLLRTFPGEAAK